ncbi:PAP2 family protein, partial [Streptomyces sp. SID10244]|nr:PAP2 family protein [Streptomyces sp. SID10244]
MAYLGQPRWWVEVLLIWGIYSAYSRVRNIGGKDIDRAF